MKKPIKKTYSMTKKSKNIIVKKLDKKPKKLEGKKYLDKKTNKKAVGNTMTGFTSGGRKPTMSQQETPFNRRSKGGKIINGNTFVARQYGGKIGN